MLHLLESSERRERVRVQPPHLRVLDLVDAIDLFGDQLRVVDDLDLRRAELGRALEPPQQRPVLGFVVGSRPDRLRRVRRSRHRQGLRSRRRSPPGPGSRARRRRRAAPACDRRRHTEDPIPSREAQLADVVGRWRCGIRSSSVSSSSSYPCAVEPDAGPCARTGRPRSDTSRAPRRRRSAPALDAPGRASRLTAGAPSERATPATVRRCSVVLKASIATAILLLAVGRHRANVPGLADPIARAVARPGHRHGSGSGARALPARPPDSSSSSVAGARLAPSRRSARRRSAAEPAPRRRSDTDSSRSARRPPPHAPSPRAGPGSCTARRPSAASSPWTNISARSPRSSVRPQTSQIESA